MQTSFLYKDKATCTNCYTPGHQRNIYIRHCLCCVVVPPRCCFRRSFRCLFCFAAFDATADPAPGRGPGGFTLRESWFLPLPPGSCSPSSSPVARSNSCCSRQHRRRVSSWSDHDVVSTQTHTINSWTSCKRVLTEAKVSEGR